MKITIEIDDTDLASVLSPFLDKNVQMAMPSIVKEVKATLERDTLYSMKNQDGLKTMQIIAGFYCHTSKIEFSAIQGKCRKRDIAEHRHILIYILRQRGFTTTTIGKYFKRDHSTVLNSEKTILGLMQTYPAIKNRVNKLLELI